MYGFSMFGDANGSFNFVFLHSHTSPLIGKSFWIHDFGRIMYQQTYLSFCGTALMHSRQANNICTNHYNMQGHPQYQCVPPQPCPSPRSQSTSSSINIIVICSQESSQSLVQQREKESRNKSKIRVVWSGKQGRQEQGTQRQVVLP